MTTPLISGVYRYPIKGFAHQRLSSAELTPGAGLPFDRFLGVAHGGTEISPTGWTTYAAFVRLAKTPRLLGFDLAFEDDSTRITLSDRKGALASARLDHPEEIAALNRQLAQWFPQAAAPRLARRNADLGWWDCADSPISLINTASVRALAEKTGAALDPLRFRGNLYLEDLPAWEEFGLIGHRLRIGTAEVEITRPMERCSATSAEPATGETALNVPALLGRAEGHLFCGLYAQVVAPGRVALGDRVEILRAEPRIWSLGAGYFEAPPVPKWPRPAEVVRRVRESADVVSLWLRDPAAATRGEPRAGQHLRVHLGGPAPLWRSYTVSAVEGDLLRLTIRDQGRASSRLTALEPGARITISGPFGTFHLPEDSTRPLVFLSAGVGITPVAAMLRAAGDFGDIRVLHTARDTEHLPLWPEVEALAQARPGLRTQLVLSRHEGRMTAAALGPLPEDAACFVCGPAEFMAEACAWLRDAGAHDIHREAFTAPADTAPEIRPPSASGPFEVDFGEGSASWTPEAGTLLELGEAEGRALPSNCRSGVCGACRMRLASGRVEYLLDIPFPLAPDEVLTCCAVPASDIRLSRP